MHRLSSLFVLCVVAALALGCFSTGPAAAAEFQPLFDGKSLTGWQGDAAIWSVKDGLLVGSTEANRSEGKLSAESPVARALLGRAPGELIEVDTPRGQRRLRIEKLV